MNLAMRRFFLSGFMVWVISAVAISSYFYWYGQNSLKFGIDLVGGSYITLEVQENDVIKNELNDKVKSFESALNHAKISYDGKPIIEKNSLIFKLESSAASREAESILRTEERRLQYEAKGSDLYVTVPQSRLQKLLSEAVDANVDILGRRLDGMSVAEIHISKQGDRQMVIELPDVRDPHQAKLMIGKSAVLDFKLVEDSASSRDQLLDKYDHELPEGTIMVAGSARGSSDDKMFYLVPEYTPVSGKYFKDAKVSFGGDFGTDLVVQFEFDDEGGNRFHELTSQNVGKLLAIVLDDEIIQVATVKGPIGKSGIIQGNFKSEEASALAKLLKSGAFKAKVNFVEEREIGPTLGQESVHKGLISCLIGLGLLLIFGLYYYRLSGLFAVFALVYNLLLVLFFLSLMKATLTLPGIAGMILTVGMAIDASILIYEHIKECLAEGMSITQAVKDGFSDAMYVILDANITTFIVAAVLFYFGTGPIQGFAVTMMIGIVSTLLTGLFFLKSIFKTYLSSCKVSKLSI